tara:strand:- start:910 stop:1152 length:243 start_codon:yes stop_codon:yes gene_type:complete
MMSEKILKLVQPRSTDIDTGLVQRIEGILEMARSGELQSFSAVGVLNNGDMMTSAGPTPDPWSDIGGLEILKQRLIERDF